MRGRFFLQMLCALVGVVVFADVAAAQARSWKQTPATVPQPAAAGATLRLGPATPNPASWRPSAPATTATATKSATQFYPLPGRTMPDNSVVPAAAAMPHSATLNRAAPAATRSPYAAAYLAQQSLPTLAPPTAPSPGPMWNPQPQPDTVSGSLPPGETASPYMQPYWDGTMSSPAMPNMPGVSGCDPETTVTTYDPGVVYETGGGGCGPWFFSAAGVMFTRDVPNNVGLAFYQSDPGISVLNTEQAGMNQWRGGYELRVGRSIGERWALETTYWSIDTIYDIISVRDEGNQINSRLDFQNIAFEGTPLSTLFNDSREQRVLRYNDFMNLEINVLQQALAVDPANVYGATFFTGARYFKFQETLAYWAVAANAEFDDRDVATQTNYIVRESNQLIGWQLGYRGWVNVGQRLRLFAAPRFGLFANKITQLQHACMVLDMTAHKTDLAMLGQLDLGGSYQILPCCSIFASYRAMGFSGVALADDNITRTFTSIPDMASINSSGSLILHGWQAGFQVQF